jgi:hypothetical protein
MAGEMELCGKVEQFVTTAAGDTLRTSGLLTTQQFALRRGPTPWLMMRVRSRRRTPEEVRLQPSDEGAHVRLGAGGYLQYPREGNFCPDAGAIRILFRTREEPHPDQPRVLLGVGQGLGSGGGNSFHLGFLDGGRLTFHLRDHQSRMLQVQLPVTAAELKAGEWQEVVAWWQGLNGTAGEPTAGLRWGADEKTAGAELPPDTPFVTQPNTSIWVGAAVQTPGTEAQVDVRRLEILGPETGADALRPPGPNLAQSPHLFVADYTRGIDAVIAAGSGRECAEGPLELRLHPYEAARLTDAGAELFHGGAHLHLVGVPEGSATFQLEPIPYAQAGLAGGSFVEKEDRFQRLIVRPAGSRDEIRLAALPTRLFQDEEFRAALAAQIEELSSG